MLFSMMVTMTSWAPVVAFSTPGMPPHSPPPTAPARITIGTSRIPGTSWRKLNVPTQAASVAPMRIWPSAPMLKSPARKAKATARAAPMNGVERAERGRDAVGLPNMPRRSAA